MEGVFNLRLETFLDHFFECLANQTFLLQEQYNVTTDIQSRKDKTEKSFEILSMKLWKTMKKIQKLNAESEKKLLKI